MGFLREVARKSVIAVVALAVGGLFVAGLSLSSYFSIKSIQVDRENFSVDSAKVENRLSMFLGRNLLFFPKGRMVSLIQNEFPEFAEIDVSKVFPDKITIKLVSQPIVANLRAFYTLPPAEEVLPEQFTELNKAIEELSASDPAIQAAASNPFEDREMSKDAFDLNAEEEDDTKGATEQKGLINRIGQAILDQQENLELMTLVVKGLSQPVEDRETVIPMDEMEEILSTLHYFTNEMKLEVLEVVFYPYASELHLKIKGGWWVWISLDRDTQEQIDKLKAIYEPAELSKEELSYIDIRVREKVIYCLRRSRCAKEE